MSEPPDSSDGESHSVIPFQPAQVMGWDPGKTRAVDSESAEHHTERYLKDLEESGDRSILPVAAGEADPETSEPPSSDSGVDADPPHPVAGKKVALVGRFGSMNHHEASNVLLSYNAKVIELSKVLGARRGAETQVDSLVGLIDWVVIGDEQPPLTQSEILGNSVVESAGRGEIEIINEAELWQRIGLVELDSSVRRYHTPAMLAELLDVSVRVIRRWHRRGLITPVVTVHRLPYFDYAEVATAKRLAGWIADGASPTAIEQRLAELVEVLPNIQRPLDQLSILVEGKQILLRKGDGLIEPGGQMRFDFDALDGGLGEGDLEFDGFPLESETQTLAFEIPDQPPMLRGLTHGEIDPVLASAYEAEDEDDLETAVELYHTILARDGARPDICFQIAELLYRMNFLVAARERYYVAIELDPEFVEARASLGAVLSELGQYELAVAALRGALKLYEDYADVHYTLAKTLDRLGREIEAESHWRRCRQLSPESPWADEARQRLGLEPVE